MYVEFNCDICGMRNVKTVSTTPGKLISWEINQQKIGKDNYDTLINILFSWEREEETTTHKINIWIRKLPWWFLFSSCEEFLWILILWYQLITKEGFVIRLPPVIRCRPDELSYSVEKYRWWTWLCHTKLSPSHFLILAPKTPLFVTRFNSILIILKIE